MAGAPHFSPLIFSDIRAYLSAPIDTPKNIPFRNLHFSDCGRNLSAIIVSKVGEAILKRRSDGYPDQEREGCGCSDH